MASYTDTSRNDSIVGTDAGDSFDMTHGGRDTVQAGDGKDVIDFGSTLDVRDRIDGGAGYDYLELSSGSGPSSPIVLRNSSFVNIEALFVDIGYDLTLADGNIAAGAQLLVSVNGSTRVDAGAESDGAVSFYIYGDHNTLIAGAGDDTFTLIGSLKATDQFDGGAGDDILVTDGSQRATLTHDMLSGIDKIVLQEGYSDHRLTIADDLLGAGEQLRIEVYGPTSLHLNARLETDGALVVQGSEAGDVLVGGRGDDIFIGGTGGGQLTGGQGADSIDASLGPDTIFYHATADSRVRAPDLVTGLGGDDHLDLSAIDADAGKPGDQAFRLVDSFDGQAGEAVLAYDATANRTSLTLYTDGDAKPDALILLAGDQREFGGFVL